MLDLNISTRAKMSSTVQGAAVSGKATDGIVGNYAVIAEAPLLCVCPCLGYNVI